MTAVIQAAGGIVWRNTKRGKEVAIVHRPSYGDWTIPKGRLKDGESWHDAAKREVKEETNCDVRIGDFAGCLCYLVDSVPKIVLFWHMFILKERTIEPNKEIAQLLWLSINDAIQKLDYPAERKLLSKALIPVEIAYSRQAD